MTARTLIQIATDRKRISKQVSLLLMIIKRNLMQILTGIRFFVKLLTLKRNKSDSIVLIRFRFYIKL